jgi:hypothetical protein
VPLVPNATSDLSDSDQWRRSSLCGNGGCVEVDTSAGMIRVRDSKRADSPVLSFDAAEWRAFVAGVRNAEFDV